MWRNILKGEQMGETSKPVDMSKTRPKHYQVGGGKHEPYKVIRDWGLNFNLGNAVKYISRAGLKNGETAIDDLQKALQYIQFEIEALEEEAQAKFAKSVTVTSDINVIGNLFDGA